MLNALMWKEEPDDQAEAAPPPSPSMQREELLARAGVYRVLAGVFVEEPSREFLSGLLEEGALRALSDAGIAFDRDVLEPELDILVDQLACEYATLFAASGGFPPVESVRLTGRYQQDPHYEVGQTYARWGFVLNKGRFTVFADQLGVELMFVAEMLERGAQAIAQGDPAQYRRIDHEIKRFWTVHLGRWVRGYAQLIERAAEHSFYRAMAAFLRGFAQEEIDALGLRRVEDLDQGRAVVPKSEVRIEFNADEPVCNGCTPEAPAAVDAATPQRLHDMRHRAPASSLPDLR